MQPILVTGGTGTLGREVVARLLDAGHAVRVVSCHARPVGGPTPLTATAIDLRSGEGLDAAVAGVDTIIHCATTARGDVQAARKLIAAARRANAPVCCMSPSSAWTGCRCATTAPSSRSSG
jgi:nucleoside-diphosphate-sugar epimerase